jgi:hypothetical protein
MKMRTLAVIALFLSTPAFALKLDVNHQTVELESLKDYDECQSRDYAGSICHKALLAWVKKHPDDAFQAGKLTRLHMNHYEALLFFKQAFAAKKGDCKDKDVKLAVMAGLGLPSDDPLEKSAQDLAFGTCYGVLKDDLVGGLADGGYYVSNACGPLRKRNALTGTAVEQCKDK